MMLTIRSGGDTGKTVELSGERLIVGRDESCDLVLADDKVSRRHAVFVRGADGAVTVEDLGSTNGTTVDGNRITEPVRLHGGETITIGDTDIEFTIPVAEPSATMIDSSLGGGAEATRAGAPPIVPLPPVPAAPPPAAPVAAASTPAAPPPPRVSTEPTPSRIERLILKKSVRRAQTIALGAGVAVVIAIIVVVLFVTGVIGGGESTSTPTIPEIVAAVKPSTVQVDALVNGKLIGSGTGWVLDGPNGLIVTNQHVVNDGSTFLVIVGASQRKAEVVAAAPCEDLAVLKVTNKKGLVTLPLGAQSTLEQGQTVVALGFPGSASGGKDLTATSGVVSVVKTKFELSALDVPNYPNVIQTDAAINPGNSGGPLVDLDKNLVGVNSAGITLLGGRTIQGQGYAIGVDRVKLITADLRKGKSIGWTGMGFDYPTQSSDLTDLDLPGDKPGLIVSRVVPGSPAAKAGFGKFPALLTAIDGKKIDNSLPSYCTAVKGLESGDKATFTVIAQGDTDTQDVTVKMK